MKFINIHLIGKNFNSLLKLINIHLIGKLFQSFTLKNVKN